MLKHVHLLMQEIIVMLLGCIKTLLLPTVFISINAPSLINAPLTFYEKKMAKCHQNGFRTLNVLYVCPNFISFLGRELQHPRGHLLE